MLSSGVRRRVVPLSDFPRIPPSSGADQRRCASGACIPAVTPETRWIGSARVATDTGALWRGEEDHGSSPCSQRPHHITDESSVFWIALRVPPAKCPRRWECGPTAHCAGA